MESQKSGLQKQTNIFEAIIKSISRIASIAGMIVLVLMMLLTVADVFLRFAFRRPILGSTELTEYMMVFLSLGMAWCLLQGKSIRMDMIVERFSARGQASIDSITYIISLGILVLMTWHMFTEGIAIRSMMLTSSTLRIPTYPFYWVFSLGLLIFSLAVLINLVKSLTKAVRL
jgi:TRAP-type transport system small permease protein